ncbi:MAG TPA: JAB domain-containing protein [Cyclobacteriaceae bacterium]|jgi:DNA repair protein RadC|nr:JAB domain-containing protein [Cyclobacteriaceae bacterium]
MNVRLTSDQKIKILNSTDIFKIMQQILLRENKIRRNQEHFWVIGLNNAHKILFIELVSLGATNRVEVAPPEVFRVAIYKSALRMVMVHNHPSGALEVSEADKNFTDRMLKSGTMLNIEVIDHLVITEEGYTSFSDTGLLYDLKRNGNYEIVEKGHKAQLEKIRREAEREKELLEIAKKFKKAGVDVKIIQQATGLKKAIINKLK